MPKLANACLFTIFTPNHPCSPLLDFFLLGCVVALVHSSLSHLFGLPAGALAPTTVMFSSLMQPPIPVVATWESYGSRPHTLLYRILKFIPSRRSWSQ